MVDRFEKFTNLIIKAYRCIQKIKNAEMAEVGLKGNQVFCIFQLYNKEGNITPRDLCVLCDEDKGAISRTLKILDDGGYLYVESDGEKKYRKAVKLTDKGRDIGKIINQKVEQMVLAGSNTISKGDLETFYKTLSVITNNLNSICDGYRIKI